MTKYEVLPTIQIDTNNAKLSSHSVLPELVYLDDPALTVMIDFNIFPAQTISADVSIDDALNKMKIEGVHLLLVINDTGDILGIVASEDILGEKPIMIQQERRIDRNQILVSMIMTPANKIIAFDINTVKDFKVGHIVNTLKSFQQHYALVAKISDKDNNQIIRGLFNTSQISKQLHMDIANSSANSTVSDLRNKYK